ncbi:hypothetical protein D3C74_437130 [compost metagenome]
MKNCVVRLGPKRTTACIHASGATIEASRQAYSTSGMFCRVGPTFGETMNSGNSTTTATSTCRYRSTSGGSFSCHFFNRVL